jgi:hypothetical protein
VALVGCDVLLGPRREACALPPRGIIDPEGRIRLDQLRFDGPSEQTAQSIEKVTRLRRCGRSTLSAVQDNARRDFPDWLIACCFEHVHEDVIALSTSGR